MANSSIRTYTKEDSVVFCKTTDAFGGLSNMASGFPIEILGFHIRNSEALYQACRFPANPGLQLEILQQASPMAAKMISRENDSKTRCDWMHVRYKVMEWCISVKLLQNWEKFSALLLMTKGKNIVEFSMKDNTWGASPAGNLFVGTNALGRLLMKVREDYILPLRKPMFIRTPDIPDFRLCGFDIPTLLGEDGKAYHL